MTTVRPAAPLDYPDFARLFPELAVDDPLPAADKWARDLCPTTFVATDGGRVVGYAFFQVLSGVGYVRNVVTDPSTRGKGVGRALMDAMAEKFRAAGATDWCLNVKPDNVPALRLYERVGMRKAYDSVALRLKWEQIAKLPRARGVSARQLAPDEEPRFEAALKLPAGLLADHRRRGRTSVGLFAGEAPHGAASFDPEFPGAFPFKVSAADEAGALFDGLRPFALPKFDYVQLVVEDDARLAEVLEASGAKVKLEFVHFRGKL